MVGRPKRGQSRLSPQPDPNVDRLRREVDEEIRHLSTEDDCCVSVRLNGIRIGKRQWLNLIEGDGIEITATDDPQRDEVDVTIEATGGGGGAPADAEYIVAALNGGLSAERVLTEGNGIDVSFGAGTATVAVDESELALYSAPVVTTAATGAFSAESVLTEGHAVDITVGGGTATVAVDESELDYAYTMYDVDFSTLANNTLVTGAEVIDGRDWTMANSANATTTEILNGTGLHFDASTNNNAFTSSSQSAPYLSTTWADLLGADYSPLHRYEISLYIPTLTAGANNNKFCFGCTNPSTFTDLAMATYLRTGGAWTRRSEGAGGSTTVIAGGPGDTLHLIVEPNLIRVFYGTWAGGFASPSSWTFGGQARTLVTNGLGSGSESSYLRSDWRIVIAFVTGEASGNMDVVVRNLRVRRIV